MGELLLAVDNAQLQEQRCVRENVFVCVWGVAEQL